MSCGIFLTYLQCLPIGILQYFWSLCLISLSSCSYSSLTIHSQFSAYVMPSFHSRLSTTFHRLLTILYTLWHYYVTTTNYSCVTFTLSHSCSWHYTCVSYYCSLVRVDQGYHQDIPWEVLFLYLTHVVTLQLCFHHIRFTWKTRPSFWLSIY